MWACLLRGCRVQVGHALPDFIEQVLTELAAPLKQGLELGRLGSRTSVGTRSRLRPRRSRSEQIPPVARDVEEDGNAPVRLLTRFADELDSGLAHRS